MGEVYRARDTKLGRDIALKILPDSLAHDPERLARFRREAQVLAALNHPHIGAIYGLDEANGTQFLVLELVDGESLDQRIARGPIPVNEALGIAKHISEALEAAHEKGIIHRDLKPANIALTADGQVKVLDFGLAKAFDPNASSGAGATMSPTLSIHATQAGIILGTAAYMAPEQARGKAADRRADIWAFGVLLYEMLAGRRPFDGATISDTLAGVLTKEPEWHGVPAKTHRLLKSCLEKDPKQRLRDIADAWRLLDEGPVPVVMASRLPWVVAGVLAIVTIALAAALWRFMRPIEAPLQPAAHLDLDLGSDVSLGSTTTGATVILSPDGTRLVFVSQSADGTRRLFTRRLDQPNAVRMSGTEGAYAPVFSPDGQWVGFFAQGKLKKTRIDGGEPISLCDAPAGRGASWSEDGTIIAALDPLGGLSQIPPEGGKTTSVTTLSPGENTHRWPQVLPGRQAALFNASVNYGNYDEADIAVVSLKEHRRKNLLAHAGMFPRYLPSGHLVYVTKGMLFAVPFDADRLEVRGPATMLEEVLSNPNMGSAQLDFSHNGSIAYRIGTGPQGLFTMQWLDAGGKTVPLGTEPATYFFPRLSPDGSRLATMVLQGASSDLWIYDLLRGSKTLVTRSALGFLVWSLDGQFVVFQARDGMFWARADGAGQPQPLTQSKNIQYPFSFAPDGRRLVFSELTREGRGEIRTVAVESAAGQLRAGEPQLFLKTATANAFPAFSPDGRWLAYTTAEGGRYEVYVRAFPDTGTQVQISNNGGVLAVWSRTGPELFYRTEDQRIMVANYSVKGGSFIADKPRVWSGRQLADLGLGANLDLAPDGKRFVVLTPTESTTARERQSHVMLVFNFFDEVRRAVAQGK
jgi:serine/threonine-protein kinase